MATTASSPRASPQVPRPDFMARSPPRSFPTVAPQPAPTFPSASGSSAVRANAAAQASAPMAASGWALSPTSRSKRQAPTTMGTRAPSTGKPMPRAASSSMTPVEAASPKALPPASTTACTASIMFSGRSRSVSRVAGPPPRTSTPHTAPRAPRPPCIRWRLRGFGRARRGRRAGRRGRRFGTWFSPCSDRAAGAGCSHCTPPAAPGGRSVGRCSHPERPFA